MKISIIGTGYIGLIQAVGLSKLGFEVIAVDVFPEKIEKLKAGIPTIYEDGLAELLTETKDHITFTCDMKDISGSDIIFLCVGTPQDDSGKTDLGYVFGACQDIKPYLTGGEIVIIKSTVPVGTNAKVSEIFKQYFLEKNGNFQNKEVQGRNFSLKGAYENVSDGKEKFSDEEIQSLSKFPKVVSNPEFLREGVAIKDFFSPDRIVFGFENERDTQTIEKVKSVYHYFEEKNIPILTTDWQTAELIKYAANSFLATKITFINEIARLSDSVGANIKDIAKAIGMDDRIGAKFLNAGIGYGGSCFPKDVKSLIHQFKQEGLAGEIISKVDDINSSQVEYFLNKIFTFYDGDLHGKTIGVLGVAFKPDTDDLRESKGIEIIKKLMYAGAKLKVYDYNKEALHNFKKYLDGMILANSRGFFGVDIVESFEELTKDTHSLVITLEDKKILQENFKNIKLQDNIIFDGKNILDKKTIEELGMNYVGVGC